MDTWVDHFLGALIMCVLAIPIVLIVLLLKRKFTKHNILLSIKVVGGIIVVFMLIVYPMYDLLNHNYASRISVGLVSIAIFFILFYFARRYEQLREAKQRKEEEFFSVIIDKANDYAFRRLGSEIKQFKDDYQMDEYIFERDIFEVAVRKEMEVYRESHPLH